jgi:hypothetical protein
MALHAPPRPPAAESDIDAGVIEDARARQRSHRRVGAILFVVAITAGALVVSFRGGGSGGNAAAVTPGPEGSGANGASTKAFQGAPTTQRNGYGVLDRACPLAAPNRYLPARAGCVDVKRVDLTGVGQSDVVIVYSLLNHRHPYWYAGRVPSAIAKDFVPEHPYLKVLLPNGASVTTQIRGPRGTWAASIDFIEHLANPSRRELILGVTRGSFGGQEVAYGMQNGRLIAAGPVLNYGGDSADAAGFTCRDRNAPGIVQRTFQLIGPGISGWWRETIEAYSWNGAKLTPTNKRTTKVHGRPPRSLSELGTECGPTASYS